MRSNSSKKVEKLEKQTTPDHTAAPPSNDFEKVVQESKSKIQSEELKTIKRARGRPSLKANHDKSTVLNDTQTAAPGAPQSLNPAPDISPMLIEPLKMLSGVPARRYKCPELALSQDEAQACAKSLNDILNAFVPDMSQMSPKTAAILGGCIVFGSIATNKYLIYSAHIEKLNMQNEQEHKEDVKDQPINPEDRIDAGQAFRKFNANA